jgi:hypothetical protein
MRWKGRCKMAWEYHYSEQKEDAPVTGLALTSQDKTVRVMRSHSVREEYKVILRCEAKSGRYEQIHLTKDALSHLIQGLKKIYEKGLR